MKFQINVNLNENNLNEDYMEHWADNMPCVLNVDFECSCVVEGSNMLIELSCRESEAAEFVAVIKELVELVEQEAK